MNKQLLAKPVEYGDVLLAPTTELAALAELAAARTEADRLATIKWAAATIQAEDASRRHLANLRTLAEARRLPELPQRQAS